MKFYQSGLSFFRKTALDEPLYKLSAGRSMVEMLGVLAIIGVLSVGAIAGYSKAMMKYKLNKQAEQLSTLINAGLRYSGQWNLSESVSLIPYLIKLNEVPNEMIKSQGQVTIYDVFNTALQMTYTIHNSNIHYTQFFIQLDTSNNSNQSLDICRNVVNVAKEFHANLWRMVMASHGDDETWDGDQDSWDNFTYYGDAYCSSGNNCLKDMTVEQIDTFCRYNSGKPNSHHLKLVWME